MPAVDIQLSSSQVLYRLMVVPSQLQVGMEAVAFKTALVTGWVYAIL